MRPRCSILTGGFDFSGCGDCTACPPFEQTEMSNSEPSAIVVQRIACMRGLYKFSRIIQVSIRMEKTIRSRFAAIHPKPFFGIKARPPAEQEKVKNPTL